MPELPEVEVTRLSLQSITVGKKIQACRVHQRMLRYPILGGFAASMKGNRFIAWLRRGKYLIAELERGYMLVHLGMSGRLTHSNKYRRVRHDHIIWRLEDGLSLVYHDPRRFGCVLHGDSSNFALIENMGPEPLAASTRGASLHGRCGSSQRYIKNCLMDQRVIAGLGNIYVCESLFASGIHPQRIACDIGREEYNALARAIKRILRRALKAGGTSLKDFAYGSNWPGYFAQSLNVYERKGLPCPNCQSIIQRLIIANRSSYLCPRCQPLKR